MPGEAIYIPVAPTDVLVARKVGCCVASVCWASTAQGNVLEPLHPDTIVHTVNELKGVGAAEGGHLIVSTSKSKREDQEANDRSIVTGPLQLRRYAYRIEPINVTILEQADPECAAELMVS